MSLCYKRKWGLIEFKLLIPDWISRAGGIIRSPPNFLSSQTPSFAVRRKKICLCVNTKFCVYRAGGQNYGLDHVAYGRIERSGTKNME